MMRGRSRDAAGNTVGAWARLMPAACLLLAACGQHEATAGGSDVAQDQGAVTGASAAGFPGLYVDRVLEVLTDGRNAQRDGYRQRLQTCQEAGVPTTPLSSEEEALIATERWRLWRGDDYSAMRTESWMVGIRGGEVNRETMCDFLLEYSSTHVYIDARRTIEIDLVTGERSEHPGVPDIAMQRVDDPGIAEANQAARQSGMTGPVRITVAGQPCDQWTSPDGSTACVWAGGLPWGLTSEMSGPFHLTDGISDLYIVLQADPAADATGTRVETRRLEFGAPQDRGDILPAEGSP